MICTQKGSRIFLERLVITKNIESVRHNVNSFAYVERNDNLADFLRGFGGGLEFLHGRAEDIGSNLHLLPSETHTDRNRAHTHHTHGHTGPPMFTASQ